MEADNRNHAGDNTEGQQYHSPSSQGGRPPPIVLTSQVNPIQLLRQLKGLLKGDFRLRKAKKRTRVVMSVMADFQPAHLTSRAITSQKAIRSVIRQVPISRSAEDISDGFINFGFDIISVKPMSPTCQSPVEGTTTVNIPLVLITLPMMSKYHEIFKLTSLRHIAIRIEAYRAQAGLTQCYNCQ
jgi:hypothetical protein